MPHFRQHYNTGMFNGVEFDATMLRIAAMNLQLHGIEHPNLVSKDALSESNAGMKDQFTLVIWPIHHLKEASITTQWKAEY